MKILQNLWQVGGGSFTAAEDAAVYLIRFGQQAALIDAGCGHAHNQLVANISAVLPAEIPIPYLFLTHCHYDHVGRAAALRDQYGCKRERGRSKNLSVLTLAECANRNTREGKSLRPIRQIHPGGYQ